MVYYRSVEDWEFPSDVGGCRSDLRSFRFPFPGEGDFYGGPDIRPKRQGTSSVVRIISVRFTSGVRSFNIVRERIRKKIIHSILVSWDVLLMIITSNLNIKIF